MISLGLVFLLSFFSDASQILTVSAAKQSLETLDSQYFKLERKKFHYYRSPDKKKRALVILPGMGEPAFKYWEVYEDLKDLGFQVYIWDHLGQGLSDPADPSISSYKIYVLSFENYLEPLQKFFSRIEIEHEEIHVLAHSMGAHLLLRSLQDQKIAVSSAILSAPMLRLKTSGLPYWLVRGVLRWGFELTKTAPFQAKTPRPVTEQGHLSGYLPRRQLYKKLFSLFPEQEKAGGTVGWVLAAISSLEHLYKKARWGEMNTPTLMLLADSDVIVSVEGSQSICKKMPQCTFAISKDSQHEIFMENNAIRDLALGKVRNFLKKHQSH